MQVPWFVRRVLRICKRPSYALRMKEKNQTLWILLKSLARYTRLHLPIPDLVRLHALAMCFYRHFLARQIRMNRFYFRGFH